MAGLKHPVTPDGRYFAVRGRLWRLANPNLSSTMRAALVSELMVARSAVKSAKVVGDQIAEAARMTRSTSPNESSWNADRWWMDGSPDLNKHLVRNTSYA